MKRQFDLPIHLYNLMDWYSDIISSGVTQLQKLIPQSPLHLVALSSKSFPSSVHHYYVYVWSTVSRRDRSSTKDR